MQKFFIKDKTDFSSGFEVIDVNTGDIQVSSEPVILQSIALGSCIALVVFDRNKKIGGLAHIMLPGKSPSGKNNKYTADAIETLIDSVKKLGAIITDLEISVVGGANVLRDGDIPDKIIISVLDHLKKSELEINGMRVGGFERRSIFLNMESGKVFFTEGNNKTKTELTKIEKI